jgi:hypothetical protein
MSFCCAAENQFGPKVAERDLQRYRRRGPDIVTKLMLTQLRRWPLQNKQLLNIGRRANLHLALLVRVC